MVALNQNQHKPVSLIKRDPNKFATTNITNELADAITGHHPIAQTANVGGPPLGQAWSFLGRVVEDPPAGGEAFTDNRYWVKPVLIKAGGDNGILMLADDGGADPEIFPVTDLSAKPPNAGDASGDRNLASGDWVWVYAAYDTGGEDAQLHYFTIPGGGKLPKGPFQYMGYVMVTAWVGGMDYPTRTHPHTP